MSEVWQGMEGTAQVKNKAILKQNALKQCFRITWQAEVLHEPWKQDKNEPGMQLPGMVEVAKCKQTCKTGEAKCDRCV